MLEHGLNRDYTKHKVVFWNLDRGPGDPVPGAAPIVCDRMAYSPDGRWLATAMLNGNSVMLRDAVTCQPIKTFTKRAAGVGGIIFSPDGRILAAHSPGISIWDMRSGHEICSIPDLTWSYHAFSADGDRLAGVTYSRDWIELFKDVKTNPRRVLLVKSEDKELRLAFSPDGKTLAGDGAERPVSFWDTTSGRKLAEFPGTAGSVECMAFTTGGQSLIFASQDGRVRSWHFDKRTEQVPQLAGHQREVWALAYTPDGATLLSAGDDHSIKLWDSRDGRLRATFMAHDSLVTSLAVNAGGTLLASASFDKTVRLWKLPGGETGPVLTGHTDRVRAVAFSSDGKNPGFGRLGPYRPAVGSGDRRVDLRD